MKTLRGLPFVFLVVLALSVFGGTASAAFPGKNGKIAFNRLNSIVLEGGRVLVRGGASDPAFAPGGRRLAFISYENDQQSEISIIRRDGTRRHQVTNGPGRYTDVGFSPSGKRLVAVRVLNGRADVWTLRTDGTGLRRLTDTPAFERSPVWSPSGRFILYVKKRSGGSPKAWTMRRDGSRNRRFSGRAISQADFSPDGRRIIYSRGGNVFTMSVATRRERLIARNGGAFGAEYRLPVFSPDGRFFAAIQANGANYVIVRRIAGDASREIGGGNGKPPIFGLAW